MASSAPNCDICSSQQKSVSAEVWCVDCEEYLCTECKKHHGMFKGTRNHDTLPINEYNKIPDFILEAGQVCNEHNERFIMYCKDHASPICRSCILEDHTVCKNLVKIEQFVSNIKSSTAFTEIEETLSDMSKNIEKFQTARQENLLSLHKQKLQVENDIGALRAKINNHLDKIQSEIINDLYEKENRERQKIESVLQSLSVHDLEIKQLQEDIVAVKKHASDLQAFLVLGEIEKRSNLACKKVLGMYEAGDFNNSTLKHFEHKQTCLSNSASVHFGRIVTEVSPTDVKILTNKEKQAQLPIDVQSSHSIQSVAVKLNRTINTGCRDTRGCVLLPDSRSLFTSFNDQTVASFNKDGSRENIKQLLHSDVYDISYSDGMNTIFISSGGSKIRQFNEMNLDDGNIKHLETDSYNYGVAVKQDKLIYCADVKGLCERNLSDGSVRVIVNKRLPSGCYVAEHRDQLYYTNSEDNSVTCCGMDGRQIWKFKNHALKCPYGVSVDSNGNVYVVGHSSANVVLISADGQRHKEILSKKDGLKTPRVLFYQRSNNQLLVADRTEKASLFDVSFI